MTKKIDLEEVKLHYLHRGYTDIELANRLGVDRTAIYKCRQKLADTGVDFIELERGRYKIDRQKFVTNIPVSLTDSLVLYLATRRLSRNTRLAKRQVQNALEKLAVALHKPMTEQLVKAAANVPDHPEANKREFILEELIRGWAEQYKVRIRYRGLKSAKATKHVISPYLIEPSPWSDSVYVIGHSDVWDDVKPFQLERIEKAALSTEPFEIDTKFEEETLFKYTWGIWYSDQKPQIVKLRFAGREAIRRLQESVWHPEQEIEPKQDGSVIWSAPIAEWREMLPWVRSWGSDVKVLEPEGLRKALKREARRLAELYGVVGEHSAELFYAHSKPDLDEYEWQLLIDHLRATADLAFELGQDASVSELAKTAGLLHDIGKYSKEFQARLRGSNRRVDHATAGAREIMKLFPDRPQKDFAEIISYCIAGHHTGLPDYGSMSDTADNGTLLARREKKELKNYNAYKTEIDTKLLTLPGRRLKPARFRLDGREKQYIGFSISFLTRMVFSALVDADWLETECYMQDEVKPRGQHADISTLAEQFNRFLQRFDNPQNELNRKRTETLKQCLTLANSEPGFFLLTVPTGGGKTYASMAFALNHAIRHGLRRIIYVIPFTGIIEQNANVFREALGNLGLDNVLEHHSNFDWDVKRKDEDDESTSAIAKLKLAAENWDIPIIVTTNVQFFESLFASKKRATRKLHNIAKSVIIFDEAQVLPGMYLKPSLLAIQELVQNYGASAVFCTATQPSLQQFFPAKIQFTELAPNQQELFDFYRRVRVENLATQTDEDIISALQSHRQALCIVNTRKHAKGLFAQLDGESNFHLSTLMCPAHREKTMQEIRQRLADGKSCRVVSTQVMEAGIDLDFPVGYRAMAGLDSIIQAAGRVNREGKQASGTTFVFTPKTGSCTISVRINCLEVDPMATYVNLTERGKRMDGGHLWRDILLLVLIWQLVESVKLWQVVRNYEQQAKKRRSKRKKRRKRSPAEFQGLTKKPLCELCVAGEGRETASLRRIPPLLVQKRGRPRQVDTAHQFCANERCDYYGWTGRGNICSNGHPNGGEWRQLYCGVCRTYFLETKGTIFYGKRLMTRLMVRVLTGLAEGLGIRAVGRVFEVEPETVLAWLVEAAQQLELFSSYQLRELSLEQLQLDELYGLVSQVKAAEVGQPEAIERPQRSSYWVWVALDPVSKLWLSLTVGDRTLVCAQQLVHQVVQMLVPGCVPLFVTDGLADYELALLTHFGHWVQPQHRQGRRLKPRWMPLPTLDYAQVIKKRRRRRLVQVSRRVIFGSLERIKAQLVGHGWQINTAFIERLNLSIRQHVPGLGRRVTQLAKSVTSLSQQGLLYQTYYNFCLPHASLRRPLPQPTQGRGSTKLWQPCTPAIAVGVTDKVWTLREVLLLRVPPWPQTGLG